MQKGLTMTMLPGASPEGEARRDAALALLRARRRSIIRECERAAVLAALDHGAVTADDVRAVVAIPPGMNPKLVGVVFRDLADAGILRRDGYRQSRRPAAHARPLSVWRLTDAAAAWGWLAANPSLPIDE